MRTKQDKQQMASAIIYTAIRKRNLAQRLLEEAEADLAQAKQLMEEAKHEQNAAR